MREAHSKLENENGGEEGASRRRVREPNAPNHVDANEAGDGYPSPKISRIPFLGVVPVRPRSLKAY